MISASAGATPANKNALEKFFGPHLPAELNSCAACHVKADGHGATSLEDFPHNPFGKSLAALDGKISERLDAVLEKDADNDGVSNLHEILTGRFPGKTNQQGTFAEPTLLDRKKKEFAEFQKRYPWKPFESVKRPEIPTVSKTDWARNEIDVFIAAEHEARGLNPRPEAAKEIWLRRVTVDLTGLVPTPEEIRAFQADESETAYETVVDRLLASPRYGERWGRHWMDVWRYSDWAGYRADLRESARHIWHWRDWIVETLNEGVGYDEMIRQMFAADELYPGDEEKLRATGYLARNFHRTRDKWMDDVVTHT
ncbi:MAG: DUF1549 domain-containing protein, partial [Verrucomicrobiales bacterium]|nr:DUF1549 domain-containing protein [Verrucomicrobiales bacterium]